MAWVYSDNAAFIYIFEEVRICLWHELIIVVLAVLYWTVKENYMSVQVQT